MKEKRRSGSPGRTVASLGSIESSCQSEIHSKKLSISLIDGQKCCIMTRPSLTCYFIRIFINSPVRSNQVTIQILTDMAFYQNIITERKHEFTSIIISNYEAPPGYYAIRYYCLMNHHNQHTEHEDKPLQFFSASLTKFCES